MKFDFTKNPSYTDIQFLSQKIDAETIESDPISKFGFFMRNNIGEMIAGCNDYIMCESIYTDQLWVEKDYRKIGLGKQLIIKVEEYGRKSSCNLSTINTMSFQGAKGFYEKLGYVVDFERHGYAKDASLIFLSKKLKI